MIQAENESLKQETAEEGWRDEWMEGWMDEHRETGGEGGRKRRKMDQ